MTEYIIERLGHLGDGIAAGPIYAPLTLPGERVTGILEGDRLSDVRITQPSGDRVTAPCRQFRRCGGCSLQHASEQFLSYWKLSVVREALAAHRVDADVVLKAVSPARSRRRATFAARRTKSGALVGFHMRGSDEIVAIPDCQLLHPRLMAALPLIEQLAIIGASRKQPLDVFVTTSDTGLDIMVSGGKPLTAELIQILAACSRDHDVARLCWGEEVAVLRAAPEQRFDGLVVCPPPGAFLQPTAEGEEALRATVMQPLQTATRALDLFAGCGTFALPLARQVQVHAVEGDRAMTATLDQGWRHNSGLKAVTTEVRDLFRNPLTPAELRRFDAVVMDPPRAGAQSQTAQLAEARVPVLAYVSCNPLTFARDAARLLSAGYRIGEVAVVDQFRWSPHVELSCIFTV